MHRSPHTTPLPLIQLVARRDLPARTPPSTRRGGCRRRSPATPTGTGARVSAPPSGSTGLGSPGGASSTTTASTGSSAWSWFTNSKMCDDTRSACTRVWIGEGGDTVPSPPRLERRLLIGRRPLQQAGDGVPVGVVFGLVGPAVLPPPPIRARRRNPPRPGEQTAGGRRLQRCAY